MTRHITLALLLLTAGPIACSGVAPEASPPHAYELGTIGGFAELVNSGVKTLAMSEVLPPAEMTAMLPEAEKVAARNNVKLYRESRLLVTDLFPADVARDKDVLLIYQGGTLDQYLALKAEAEALDKAGQYTGQGARSHRAALRPHAELSHLAHQPAAGREHVLPHDARLRRAGQQPVPLLPRPRPGHRVLSRRPGARADGRLRHGAHLPRGR